MKAHHLAPGPVHLLRLATDSDLYDEITSYVRDHGIQVATVTILGAVRRAALRYYDQDLKVYEDFVIDEPLEVVAGVGNVSLLDGEPFLHLHAAFSAEDGRGFGGHLNTGTIVWALEAHVQELEGDPPVRSVDDCTGLTLW